SAARLEVHRQGLYDRSRAGRHLSIDRLAGSSPSRKHCGRDNARDHSLRHPPRPGESRCQKIAEERTAESCVIVFSCRFRELAEELLYAVARVVGARPLEKTVTVMPILAGDTFVSQRIRNGRSLVDVPESGFGAVVERIKRAVKKLDRLPDCTVMQVKI